MTDKTERDVHERSGYEFHHAENQEEIVITTETPDEEVWLNDGDPDSPFFHTPRSAANTEIREIPMPSDSWPAWNEEEVNPAHESSGIGSAPPGSAAGPVRSHPHHHQIL